MWGRVTVTAGGDGMETRKSPQGAFWRDALPDAREWPDNGCAGPEWAASGDISAADSESEGETI